ncbi:endonuclease/exonuclease/phosphatase family protein [Chitinophaga sp. Cy-1792]|uniref:endonuclease/exonuclease/phosphatase family protein n=1 Tax=Chitinophaga sp. Cy-1792 TaxID=2608339 RepID=UPI0014237832|nr:endonuclease/exonuclease/phosphatase family protein [Chitinophaga sp. Cy-1792]NIG56843.1 endonuclease/exonuclease/phosphatase family protein [Chitinophaga sp. Cy-1792]
MKKIIPALALAMLSVLTASAQTYHWKVLQLNIWQEGTMVPGGYDAIVNEIDRLEPDFVMLSEVRNYKNTRFCDRITASLAAKGKTYYSFFSNGAGVMSRYPITDSATVFEGQGEIYKLTTVVDKQTVVLYSGHLDYLNYAVYLPRGYDGVTWKKLPAPCTNLDTIMASNRASSRDEAITAFLQAAKADINQKHIILLGGDFNEASHLDWTAATKDSFDHHGMIVPWTCSEMLYSKGFKDSYRELHPNPVKFPGFTFPANNISVPVKQLAWAPDADERERIDFIYYYPQPGLKVVKSSVVGPTGSIVRNQREEENTKDPFIQPAGTWPTDHKGVLTEFIFRK